MMAAAVSPLRGDAPGGWAGLDAGAPSTALVLIGLTGKAGAGKDAAADRLCAEFGFVRAAFAAPIKAMGEALLEYAGLDHAWMYERRLKERTIPELMASPRHMLQTLGTEWGRQCMGAGFWVRLLEQHLGLGVDLSPVHDRIVVTDVRFANEAAWVRAHGGTVVRIVRDQAAAVRAHASEAQMDSIEPDTTIFNGGAMLDGLHELVDGLAATLGCERREPMPDWMCE